jgi:uncharacterized membrane protein
MANPILVAGAAGRVGAVGRMVTELLLKQGKAVRAMVIEEQATLGNRVADAVARFGGSWSFIICCLGFLAVYVCANVSLGHVVCDPYPFILLNLFLSMLAAIQAPIIMMRIGRCEGPRPQRA